MPIPTDVFATSKRIVVESPDVPTADAEDHEEDKESPGSMPSADLEQQRAEYTEFRREWLF